jgi:hypothetical protein
MTKCKKRSPNWGNAFCWKTRRQSCHAATRVPDNNLFDYRLIFGDNLLSLFACEWEIAGRTSLSTSKVLKSPSPSGRDGTKFDPRSSRSN